MYALKEHDLLFHPTCPFTSNEEVNHGYAQMGSKDIKKTSFLAGYIPLQ